jgi:hypothetical protein
MRYVAVLVVALAGCSSLSTGHEPVGTSNSGRVGAVGVTVELPSGWHALAPNDGNIIDPLTRVAVSSAPGPEHTRPCHTQVANYAPRPDAVTLVILEWKPASDVRHPPRPIHFNGTTMPLEGRSIECFDGDGASAFFQDRGRFFGAYLLLGRRASPRLAAQARGVLETLRVTTP